jgi:hypothetical protein
MNRLAARDPHRGFLQKRMRNLFLAYAAAALIAVGAGMAVKGLRKEVLRSEFDARAVEVPGDLRSALRTGDAGALRAAVSAHSEEALRLMVDPVHGLPVEGPGECARIIEACARALPLEKVKWDLGAILRGPMVPRGRKEAALRILELSGDPEAEKVLESIVPDLEGAFAEEARRILERRKARGGRAEGR